MNVSAFTRPTSAIPDQTFPLKGLGRVSAPQYRLIALNLIAFGGTHVLYILHFSYILSAIFSRFSLGPMATLPWPPSCERNSDLNGTIIEDEA